MTLNKKSLVWVATAILAAIVLSLSPFVFAQAAEILMNTGADMKTNRTAVDFSHDLTMGLYACLDCPPDFKEGVNVLDEDVLEEGNPVIRSSACHNDQADLDRQRAYHRQCMGCHIDTRKAGDASGPELCGACHLSAR